MLDSFVVGEHLPGNAPDLIGVLGPWQTKTTGLENIPSSKIMDDRKACLDVCVSAACLVQFDVIVECEC